MYVGVTCLADPFPIEVPIRAAMLKLNDVMLD